MGTEIGQPLLVSTQEEGGQQLEDEGLAGPDVASPRNSILHRRWKHTWTWMNSMQRLFGRNTPT
jgi:hypothetical protein